jgi:hypothetical protein
MVQGKATPKRLVEGDRRRIRITQAEIDKAKPQQSGRCLVARAIAAKWEDASRIDVDQQTVRFTRDGERWVYLTPWAVQRYVTMFDAGDPIEPFEFSLTQSVQIQRAKRSMRGKAVDAAGQRARNAKRTLRAADQGTRPITADERDRLTEVIEQADNERVTLKAEAEAADESLTVREPHDVPVRAAMTQRGIQRSRTSKRHYGHREMKLNQDRAARLPQAVEAEAGLELPPMPRGGYHTAE